MLAEERRVKILELLHRDGAVRSADLVRRLGVSAETVRKDLDFLGEKRQITRVHGGAVGAEKAEAFHYLTYQEREIQNLEAKKEMAAYAASLLEEGQCVGLDAGTSTLLLARELPRRFQRLTVLTNSLKNALALADAPGFTVIVTGGILMGDESSLVSDLAFRLLDVVNLDVLFLTAGGITAAGLTDQRIAEILVQNHMRQGARRTVAILDASKFGRFAPFKLCDLKDLDLIVTDSSADPALVQQLRESGANLKIAPSNRTVNVPEKIA